MRISGVTPGGPNKRRYERYDVRVPTEVRGKEGNFEATLMDVSEGGAAVKFEQPRFANDTFVELHTEGYEKLKGRVVREFADGFALEFDDEEQREQARAEIEKFKAVVGKQREF